MTPEQIKSIEALEDIFFGTKFDDIGNRDDNGILRGLTKEQRDAIRSAMNALLAAVDPWRPSDDPPEPSSAQSDKQTAVAALKNAGKVVVRSLDTLKALQAENAALRKKVEVLEVKNAALREGAVEDLAAYDLFSWADGIQGALGTEHALKTTELEARLSHAIIKTFEDVRADSEKLNKKEDV